MKTIVDNLAVEYLDEGSGVTLLILHGWGNTLRYFDPLCDELKDFRIVRLDAPGFGGSEMPPVPWKVEDYARFVAAFCEKLHIDPKLILGHSFGGRILVKGVSKNILHPEKIILIASAGVAKRWSVRNITYATMAKVGRILLLPLPRSFYERIRHALYVRTKSDYLTTGKMSQTFLNMIREDLSEDAANISIPTLLIWGSADLVTPLSEGKKLATLIPHSKLRVIEGAGHFVYRDDPVEVGRMIREFCV